MRVRALTVDDVIAATSRVLRRSRSELVHIDADSRFDALGVESLEMIEILIELEEATGVVIPDSEVSAVETLRELAACRPAALRGSPG